MTSSDSEIVVIIDGKEYGVQEISGRKSDFQAEVLHRLGSIEAEQRYLADRIDTLTTAVYWILGAIGIFLAALGIFTGIYMWIASARKDKPDPKPEVSMSEIVKTMNALIDARLAK